MKTRNLLAALFLIGTLAKAQTFLPTPPKFFDRAQQIYGDSAETAAQKDEWLKSLPPHLRGMKELPPHILAERPWLRSDKTQGQKLPPGFPPESLYPKHDRPLQPRQNLGKPAFPSSTSSAPGAAQILSGTVSEAWVARYQGTGLNDYAVATAVDGDGNVYVTGYSWDSGTSYDYATVKYNSAGTEQWVARYNGTGAISDYAQALAVDGAGNVHVTGYSYGSGTSYDYATVKYNSAGVQQWVARYNGTGSDYDYARDLAVDGDGNVYVTGYSSGLGTYDDYATVKYNSAGTEQWVARYNGPGNYHDRAYALAVDDDGNVYVTGYSWDSGTKGDYATFKYNSAGVQQWVARYNGPGTDEYYDEAVDLAVDGAGNVYVTGESGAYQTEPDYATVKYNSAGVQQWVARYNGPANDYDKAYALAVDVAGNVYVTGSSYDGSSGYDDYVTVKYNSAGTEQWVARYNGPMSYFDQAYALAVDGAGNVYVTGRTNGSSGIGEDYATVKYNSAGVQQWVASYNGTGNGYDYAQALAVDGAGNVYVTGYSEGSGTHDYATVKYTQTPPFTADAGPDQFICLGQSVTIGGNPTASGGTAPYTYSWMPTQGLNDATIVNPMASPATTTIYTVTVTDVSGAQVSDEVTVSVVSPPLAPSALEATAINSSRVDISWVDNSSNEESFKLERKTGTTGAYAVIATLASNQTNYSNLNLKANTTYFYRVTAFNVCNGNSVFSNEDKAITAAANAPQPPSELTVTPISNTQINLAWLDNSGDETGYKIERKIGNEAFKQVATVGANVSTYSNITLLPNTTYTYRVRAYSSQGHSVFSNKASATTLNSPPVAPNSLTAVANSETQINLTWADKSNNEDGFVIERKTWSFGIFETAGFAPANATGFADDGSYNGVNLVPGTTYYYRVRAYNYLGNSNYSNVANAATMGSHPNLALNKPATALSTTGANTPNKAVDANAKTLWQSGALSGSPVVWFQVDLAASKTFAQAIINWSGNYFAKQYELQASDDAVNWTTLYSELAGNGGVDDLSIGGFPPARYLRVYMTQKNLSYYRIIEFEVYQDGAVSPLAKESVWEESVLPEEFALMQNYPNPFNPETQITFTLPSEATGEVSLSIYSITGQLVRTLANGAFASGKHEVRWNGRNEVGEQVAAGVYLYRLTVRGASGEIVYSATKRMAMVK